MRGVTVLCILLALPALAALGHDAWLYYHLTYEEGKELGFQISDLGYLWVNYARETHDWAMQQVDPVMWEAFIRPVLMMPAIVALGIPAVAVYALLAVCWLFGIWPYNAASPGGQSQFAALGGRGRGKPGSVKYKRK